MKNSAHSWTGSIRFAAIMLLLTGAMACKKDKTPAEPEYFMRFKANGTLVEYALSTYAVLNNTSGFSNATFSGAKTESNMVLQIFWPVAITEGTYTEAPGPGSFTPAALFGYSIEGGPLYSSGTTAGSATINLTEIGADYARGTFSGMVEETGFADIAITEGEFFLQQP